MAPVLQLVSPPAAHAAEPTEVVYDSIGANVPGSVPSQAFQATQTSEFGDLVQLAPGQRVLDTATVEMVAWGCQTGGGASCVTTQGSSFNHTLTFRIYSVGGTPGSPTVGDELVSFDKIVAVPFRPSADLVNCTGSNLGKWFDAPAATCRNGFAFPVTFDLAATNTVLPDQVIWTVAYNTSNYGANPIGPTCVPGSNCAYDSLNVGADNRGSSTAFTGVDVDPDGAFLSSVTPGQYCPPPPAVVGSLLNDTGCWGSNRPMATLTTMAFDPAPMVAYDSIGTNVPGSVPSQAFQATQTSEFGDLVQLANGPRILDSMTVEMVSWACQAGAWNTNDCATTSGATFNHPLTFSIYTVGGTPSNPTVGTKIASITQVAAVPFRPSADNVNCTGGDIGKWFDAAATACRNGFAFPVTFSFPTEVVLPDRVIWSVAYDTSNYGKSPIGVTCLPSTNCGYDSLNVGTDNRGSTTAFAGTDVDPDGAFLSSVTPGSYCPPPPPVVGSLLNDTAPGCYTAFRPMARIVTKPQVQSSTAAYDAIGTGLPNHFSSLGFEASATKEFGDLVELAPGSHVLDSMTVEMVDWGCQSGAWNTNDCVSAPNSTFSHPLTFTIYAAGGTALAPTVGAPLATVTQSVNIPFRPSADPACTGADAGKWLDGEVCRNGFAFPVTLNFPGDVALPNAVIWTVAYNTSDYGAVPIGATCVAGTNCAYDALNVGAYSRGSSTAFSGVDLNDDSVFISSTQSGTYCNPPTTLDVLQFDAGCWDGFRPMGKIVTKQPPSAPLAVVATAGDGSAGVTWTAPVSDGGSPITGYTAAPTTGPGTCVVTGLTAACSGLVNGNAVSITVNAVNAIGTGPGGISNPVTPLAPVVLTAPSAPLSVVATAGDTTATVTWLAPASDGGSPITGYIAAPLSGFGSCVVTGLTAQCTGLTNDTTYTFGVTATNAIGTGPVGVSNAVTPTATGVEAPKVLDFTPAGPRRVFDTRPGESPDALRSVAKAKIGTGSVLEVKMTELPGLVPSAGVGAVSLNVTATDGAAPGFVTVYPCGPQPFVSSVNFTPGKNVANAVIAPVSATGTVCFFASNPVHLIADVNGWIAADRAFVSVGPDRLFDTRAGQSSNAVVPISKTKLVAGDVMTVQVSGLGGRTPSTGIATVSLNVTVTEPTGAGFLTVYDCGTREEVSSVNYGDGQTVANAVLAPVSAAGTICFYSQQTTDLVVDINGFFIDPSGFTAVSPKRVLDSRVGFSPNAIRNVPKAKIGGANVLEVKVTDLPGAVPAAGVSAVSLNVTAVNPELDGYLTVYPCGTRPDSSSVNYSTGATVANAVIAPVSATGTICFYSQNLTDLVVDVNGWFSDVPS